MSALVALVVTAVVCVTGRLLRGPARAPAEGAPTGRVMRSPHH